ncbi:acyl-CoA carboxylase subunit epsilon [Actinomadura decatromicini]|uniref:Acyl-CoA carboxylase subunit epsilon n=1 Tax=Actinomadura decatromicini TaxID=2604572 RepID=A0A5D3F6M6_9ACTN|nr:acyl-CoA carboxylase subunit epsilon [Actinomadura decatromicini]TYK43961.1 acyl-CoA carboxylase subunit epsilon [Actinomadura decatromicini]
MDHATAPVLRVVRGAPTDAELAAVTAVLLAVLRARAAPATAAGRPRRPPRRRVPRPYRAPRAWTSE